LKSKREVLQVRGEGDEFITLVLSFMILLCLSLSLSLSSDLPEERVDF
jgi:hypothetical protein